MRPMRRRNALAAGIAVVAVSAVLASVSVWLVMVANFDPVPWADNRPTCSGGITIPYELNGVLVEPTFPPGCFLGPIPDEVLRPSPLPAVATSLIVGSVGLLVARRRFGKT